MRCCDSDHTLCSSYDLWPLSYDNSIPFNAVARIRVAAIVRVTMHYCTPVPGGGAGCHLVDVMDATKQVALLNVVSFFFCSPYLSF